MHPRQVGFISRRSGAILSTPTMNKPATTNALTPIERYDLKKHKERITIAAKAWVQALPSINAIKDKKLYREESKTFEEFCQKNWGWTRQWTNKVVASGSVLKSLPPKLETVVSKSIAAANSLVSVPAGRREAVVEAVIATGRPVTAAAITQAAREVAQKEDIELDATGWPIPRELLAFWNRTAEVQDILTTISKIMSALKNAQVNKDMMYAEVNFSNALGDLKRAWTSIQVAKPYAVCVTCQGHPETQPKGECRMCRGRGLISEFRWDLVPEELKAVRAKAVVVKK